MVTTLANAHYRVDSRSIGVRNMGDCTTGSFDNVGRLTLSVSLSVASRPVSTAQNRTRPLGQDHLLISMLAT